MKNISDEGKTFFKSLFIIVWPMALQNFISATVNSVDVIMLASVSQSAIAASSLAGQIVFILFMLTTGLSSGLSMLCSQYWGKKDNESIKNITGIALSISASLGLVFTLCALIFPSLLMHIFTNDANLIKIGSDYLRVVSISFFCISISQIFEASLKSVEHVKVVTAITLVTLGINVLLNACFIFGIGPFPRLGIVGVGIATSISRIIELIICVCVIKKSSIYNCSFSMFIRRNALLTHDFFKYSLPAVGNEIVWGTAFAIYSVILGHLGEDIVAANSLVTVVRNLASVLCFGMSYGGAILLGKQIGSGQKELAERNASRLIKSTILAGLAGSVIILLIKPVLPYLAHLSEAASHYRDLLMYISAYSILGAAINTVLICGVFRAGGDAKFGFIVDTVVMWFVSVPLGLISAFVLKLPPIWVYFILFLDEIEKMPFLIWHYLKKDWLRNITR